MAFSPELKNRLFGIPIRTLNTKIVSETETEIIKATTVPLFKPTFPSEETAITTLQDVHPILITDENGPVIGVNGRRQYRFEDNLLDKPIPVLDLTNEVHVIYETIRKEEPVKLWSRKPLGFRRAAAGFGNVLLG